MFSHPQHAMIQLLHPALTSLPRLEGCMSPFPQSLAGIDMLCHGISITQIMRFFFFIINIIYIHVSGSICLSICMVWSDIMFVSHSSLQSDVKWQVVRPTIRCGRGMPVIIEDPSCLVCVSCCVAGQGMHVSVSV